MIIIFPYAQDSLHATTVELFKLMEYIDTKFQENSIIEMGKRLNKSRKN